MTSAPNPISFGTGAQLPEKPINLTERALLEISRIFDEEVPGDGVGLRISVKGGGCSGLSYEMDFSHSQPGDLTVDVEALKVYMDAESSLYLKGMTIDYQGGLKGKGFIFENPNASRTCSCGESFGV